ncbi:MAG: DDE-type integrase/transposase/recombinase [Armatimonadetes bacterium]|nr:DDE-type integrase/transposase/recombinase [Armatimonadota bacterium]
MLLVLVCAAIVSALHPDWLAKPVKDVAAEAGVSAQRVSRLKRRLLPSLEKLVVNGTRRGRPISSRDEQRHERKIAGLEALLGVMQAVTGRGIHDRSLQDQLVAAADRLRQDHGMTRAAFCSFLGIPERTLRFWGKRVRDGRGKSTPCQPSKKKKRKRRRGNVGRFDLEHTLPGVQAIADTTNLKLFGLNFKVVAVQDPGARDVRRWEGFTIEEEELAETIITTIKEALKDSEGMQLVVDQGTPYMADATRQACEQLGMEHEPTKEGAPTEKATLERSFGVVKAALQPITDLTNKLVEAVPALCNVALARSVGGLLLGAYLSVYAAAARMRSNVRGHVDPEVIAVAVQEQRDKAKADDRSRRLILERIHKEYRMEGSTRSFVNAHRKHALEDIKEADRRLRAGTYACRCQTRCCDRYFAAILRNVAEEGRARRRQERQQYLRDAEKRRELQDIAAREEQLAQMPEENISLALDGLTAQWQPTMGGLLANGRGAARARLVKGLRTLADTAALPGDAARAIWTRWESKQEGRHQAATEAVRTVFEATVQEVLQGKQLTPSAKTNHTISGERPAPERSSSQADLRNYAANAGGS